MESMEAYYHQVMKREQDCEVPQTFGGFDFSSFSQNMQTNQAAVMNAKQSVLPMTTGYNNNGQWKGRPQQELNLICGHGTGNQIIYNDNTQHQSVEQHSSPNFNMLQQVSPRQFPTSLQQPASVQQQNNLQVKVEALNQVLMQRTSFTSTQESLVNNQHQKLDSQQEQVMAGSEYGEENFDSQIVHAFLWIEAKLCAKLKYLSFCDRVAYVYNPLEYAADPHAHYVSKYCGTKSVLFLGMNPGPNGMVQNGVPFGETQYVREWLKISGKVHPPDHIHPRRPVEGLGCTRTEVSGARFWGFMAKLCGTPEQFFRHCFVHNYCPLAFMTKTGKNIIPAALPAVDRRPLEAICDSALLQCVRVLRAQVVVAIGKYAADRVTHVLRVSGDESSASIRVERILHPSPASPQANSGWEEIVLQQLRNCGVLQILELP